MTDNEKIIFIMRYLYFAETHLKNDYVQLLDSYIITPRTEPEDILKLYRAKVRYEAFHEFSANLERILYGY